jgi:lantibiotic modifying enzyme
MIKSIHWPDKVSMLIREGIHGNIGTEDILEHLQSLEFRKYIYHHKKEDNATSIVPKKTRTEDRNNTLKILKTTEEISEFILSSFSKNNDGFFPLTPYSYQTNTYSLGFGTSGILWALHNSGIDIPDEWIRLWISEVLKLDEKDIPPGLLTGFAGIAYTLLDMGYIDIAEIILHKSINHTLYQRIMSSEMADLEQICVFWGISGMLLPLLSAYKQTGNSQWLDHAIKIGRLLCKNILDQERYVHQANPGFGYGASGIAYYLLLLGIISHDHHFLQCGKRWLDLDISSIRKIHPKLQLFGFRDEMGIAEPYLEIGSSGFVSSALRFWKFTKDNNIMQYIKLVETDIFRKYSILGGYLWGVSGIIETLFDLFRLTGQSRYQSIMNSLIQGLIDIHVFRPDSEVISKKANIQGKATSGLGLWRVSLDFATGSSGVLYVLSRISGKGKALFFKDPWILDEG